MDLRVDTKLAEKYSCSISYHPELGMIPLDRKPEYDKEA